MKRILILAGLAAMLFSGVFTAPASSIVPPKNCKSTKVGKKRYYVKADRLSCKRARSYTRYYLRKRKAPRRFKCRKAKRSVLVFQCTNKRANPDQVFLAFKRKPRS